MKQSMNKTKLFLIGIIVSCVLLAGLSFFGISKYASNPENYKDTIVSLDNKREAVLEMSAVAVASSAAITLLPDDIGTPIAEKLMDLSGYFLIVLSAIILEKYLVPVLGYLAFKWLIPIGLLLFLGYICTSYRFLRSISARLLLFGLAISLIIPMSETISGIIDSTYQSGSVVVEQVEVDEEMPDSKEESMGFFEDLWKDISDWGKDIKKGAEKTIDEYEAQFNNLIEALAIMIVINCVIPILVIVFFIWIIKMILGIDLGHALDNFTFKRD